MKRVHQILDIAKDMQKKDFDTVFVVVGDERMGKSEFTLHCDEYLEATNNSIAMYKEKIGACLNSLDNKGIFHMDEAIDGFYAKEGMKNTNRELEKLFVVFGAKNFITFLLITDFFLLAPYFRYKRIKGMFWIYGRGKVCFFDKDGIAKINHNHQKFKTREIRGAKPLFYDHFPKYEGRLLKQYKSEKGIKVAEAINSFNRATNRPAPEVKGKDTSKKELIIQMANAAIAEGKKPDSLAIARALTANRAYVRETIAVNINEPK